MKNILFAASECVPFIKTGGLADVVGSLPKYFDKKKYDVRVVLPKYSCMNQKWKDQLEYMDHFYMNLAGEDRYVGILKYVQDGITFYFIDNESYFNGEKPYGDWYWDLEKFCFFCRAALSALPVIGFQPDVVHCHDWQTGLIPVLLKDTFRGGDFFRNMKSVITIHNLKFQGVWDVKTIKRFTELPDYYFAPDKLEPIRRQSVKGRYCICGCHYHGKQYIRRGDQDAVLRRRPGWPDAGQGQQSSGNRKRN